MPLPEAKANGKKDCRWQMRKAEYMHEIVDGFGREDEEELGFA